MCYVMIAGGYLRSPFITGNFRENYYIINLLVAEIPLY